MAPKKRPATAPQKGIELNKEALADLHFLDPIRSRNRLIAILEELYTRLHELEQMHRGHTEP